jgi:hypothetical protein
MPDVRLRILDEFSALSAEVRTRFGALSLEQLNWRAAAGSWSVGQCLEHLITTTDVYMVDFRAIAAGTRRTSAWERWSPLSGLFGRFLAGEMSKDARKTRTPTRFVPPSDIGLDVVTRFMRSQDELLAAIKSTSSVDWDRTVLTSSFNRVATYSLAAAYRIMIEHQRRHLRQARRVTEDPAFPRRAA